MLYLYIMITIHAILIMELIRRYWRLFSKIETLTKRILAAEIKIEVEKAISRDRHRHLKNEVDTLSFENLDKIGGTD